VSTKDILQFSGEHRWLSNFHPCQIEFEGLVYPSVENAYQAAKMPDYGRLVFTHIKAGQAKRMGRALRLSEDWEDRKVPVMSYLTDRKYTTENELGRKLVATWPGRLVEGNDWGDTFWGEYLGRGLNNLGEILMKRRSRLITLGVKV
jgi:ribA/ribD-fused uncharacterized protein